MKNQIWKFPILNIESSVIRMPEGAEILTIQVQDKKPCIWALVNPENEKESRIFEIYGTGHDINCDSEIKRKYINTFQLSGGMYVFHVFERLN